MLIALFTILFLGGGSTFGPILYFDEALDHVEAAIVEDDRRKEATATLKTMKKRSKDHSKNFKGLAKDQYSDASAHDATDEGLEAFWDKYFELNSEYTNDIVDLRFELRDQLSRDEWEALFPADVREST